MTEFCELPVRGEIKQATESMGFSEMTEIQRLAIPEMLSGREVIAKAPTGTGKTCAYGVPIIQRVDPSLKYVQAVVLCPTRELCTQITQDLASLAQFIPELGVVSVYGGAAMGPQIEALRRGAQVVVATPGRLMDHMRRRNVAIDRTAIVVLDEADEMLDMGFYDDVRWILDRVPMDKQLSMFSATISRPVMDIGWLYQVDPVELTVAPVEESKPKITQYCVKSTGRQRIHDIAALIKANGYTRCMVFANTKYGAQSLANLLDQQGLPAKCLHGDMEQRMRNQIMDSFKKGEFGVLVATDVAARGIDVEAVDAVFNYEIPGDNEYYVHRIGRTGRAGKEGISYVFYGDDEKPRLKTILRYSGNEYHPVQVGPDGGMTPCEL